MKNETLKIKITIFINYFLFAILLNSVGIVILQAQNTFGVSESSASILEAFKDLSIAITSFFVASFINKTGYKNAMLMALGIVIIACLIMPSLNTFWMSKLLFAAVGASFAMIKVSVYGTIGLITNNEKQHISLMNFIESFFMIGILVTYFIFTLFIDDKNPASTEWVKVYYLLAGLALIAFFILLSTKIDESQIKSDSNSTSNLDGFTDMFKLIVVPIVIVFLASAFIYVLIEQSIMSWLPTFNNKVLKLPATLSIQMASILAGATALGRFSAAIILKNVSWLIVLVSCLVLSAILVLLALPMAQNLSSEIVTGWGNAPLVAFVFPLIGFFISPIYPAINSLILTSLPKNKHGVMASLIVIFSALGGTTGSILTGYIFQHYGGQTAFYFSLIPIGILIALLFFFKKYQSKTKA
jgi:MFS transporter, FHS family, glucose/mannose:H+ symporter